MKSLRRFLLVTSLPLIALVGVAAALIGYDGTRHEAEESRRTDGTVRQAAGAHPARRA
ncbi:MAG: hypothetical protein U5K33_05420 [Halofilum sp. (in: g-proteobacteria)]|nr:hypothetical protein [Halofilum sp. (in: g-proteobacteria)]